jgi:hypothetical protein
MRLERTRVPIKRADPIYLSPEWRNLRDRLVEERGRRCEKCGKTHEDDGTPVRLIGDHIKEIRDGGAPLDPANVQLLCTRLGGDGADGAGACHARKTAEEQRKRFAT